MIHVIAHITAKPGQRAALLAEFHKLIPTVHAEQGCVEYGPTIDVPDFGGMQTPLGPDSYAVVEKWQTAEALRAHAAAPHMAEFGKRTRDMIANRIIHVLTDA